MWEYTLKGGPHIKEATGGMVFLGHSIFHSLHLPHRSHVGAKGLLTQHAGGGARAGAGLRDRGGGAAALREDGGGRVAS